MPYHVEKRGSTWVVVGPTGKVYGRHKSKQKAQKQITAINLNERKKR